MKVKLVCSIEMGGCGCETLIDEEKIKKDKHIQCPRCGRITENPIYEKNEI